MALLTLVRHGQASFLEPNYDRLSDLGERQSAMLGEYWRCLDISFDQSYHGPGQRHLRTGQMVAQAYRGAGREWPASDLAPEFDEYAGIEVMRAFLPSLIEKHEDIRDLEREFQGAQEKKHAARIYDRLFQRVTRMWVAGELQSPEVEAWTEFCNRVEAGIARIRKGAHRNGRIVVFTSGGVIAAVARLALDLSAQKTLELSWASRNASFAEFLFSSDRFSLSSLNNLPHLTDAQLITYR